mmetsp:Transcript_14473/g.29166  ORF Transcript_14473/g.29166 Transcript_14473/m.29166 type:complete len:346 (+) Transcript_14473:1391-2428(+)
MVEFLVGHRAELHAADNLGTDFRVFRVDFVDVDSLTGSDVTASRIADNADHLRDGFCRIRVIPGNHNDLDTGGLAGTNGARNCRTRWVHKGSETEEGVTSVGKGRLLSVVAVPLEFVAFLVLLLIQHHEAKPEHTFAIVHEREETLLIRLLVVFLVDGFPINEDGVALSPDALWGSLHPQNKRIIVILAHLADVKHELVRRVKWKLEERRVVLTLGDDRSIELAQNGFHKLDHSSLRSIAGDLSRLEWNLVLLLLLVLEGGSGAKGKAVLEALERNILVVLGLVFDLGCFVDLAVIPEVLHCHDVLSKRPGLVGGNDVGRSESLNGFQVLHQDLLVSHTLRRESK